jgi:antitoxin ParD1/3/4
LSREIDVDNLVREDQKQREQERLEVLLLQGLDSGPSIEVTPEYWERKKARLLEQLQKAKPR